MEWIFRFYAPLYTLQLAKSLDTADWVKFRAAKWQF